MHETPPGERATLRYHRHLGHETDPLLAPIGLSAARTGGTGRWAVRVRPGRLPWPAGQAGRGAGSAEGCDDGQDGDQRDQHISEIGIKAARLKPFDATDRGHQGAGEGPVEVLLDEFHDVRGVAEVWYPGRPGLTPGIGGLLDPVQLGAGEQDTR